jgi:hypothetical protein
MVVKQKTVIRRYYIHFLTMVSNPRNFRKSVHRQLTRSGHWIAIKSYHDVPMSNIALTNKTCYNYSIVRFLPDVLTDTAVNDVSVIHSEFPETDLI